MRAVADTDVGVREKKIDSVITRKEANIEGETRDIVQGSVVEGGRDDERVNFPEY